jgi:hypothetical protein
MTRAYYCQPGLPVQGDGALGQVVAIAGNDLFAVNTDPTTKSFGVLIKDYASGDMPGIYCMGGDASRRRKAKCKRRNYGFFRAETMIAETMRKISSAS